MSKRFVLTFALVLAAGAFAPVFAQGTGAGRRSTARSPSGRSSPPASRWASPAGLGALGQGKAVAPPPKRLPGIPARPATSAAR